MLENIVVLLIAGVVLVVLFQRLGLGSVLGYLIAGIAVGPWGLAAVTDVDNILRFSELGVLLLLFVIGLELQPSRLWVLRRSILGLGSAQVALSMLAVSVLMAAFGVEWRAAVTAGFALALTSTAFVLQTLAERRELHTRHGREAFAILLFQDVIVIPALVLLPLLDRNSAGRGADLEWSTALGALAVLALAVALGRRVLNSLFDAVARFGQRDAFPIAALLVVTGTAWLTTAFGLSTSLGAFIAGVLLADSEFRHEIEADLEPFKGVLLGLFFMAVGMTVNLGLLQSQPLAIAGVTFALMALKFALVYLIGRSAGGADNARNLGVYLAAGGEFAFIIFALGREHHLIDAALGDLLVMAVVLSMMLAPLLIAFNGRINRYLETHPAELPYDRIDEPGNPVIIAGFGRFGQIIARILRLRGVRFTALEIDPKQVDFVRRFGNKVYYGDARRVELLRAARIGEAKLFVLAVNNVTASVQIAEIVRRHYPNLPIYARARNRMHCWKLMDLGVQVFHRDTFLSSLAMARDVLRGLGVGEAESERTVETFRRHDERILARQVAIHHDEAALVQSSREAAEELQRLFDEDAAQAGV
jgi:glutathione-regulated potassium-efflux system ancillary protein KefC/glutathione-regulated potassium-efflux system protein KefB